MPFSISYIPIIYYIATHTIKTHKSNTMKKVRLSLVTITLLIFSVNSSQAQLFKKLKDKVSSKIENKVDKAVDGVLDGNDSANKDGDLPTSDTHKGSGIFAAAAKSYSFQAGMKLFFEDDFSKDSLGDMAKRWTTSGSGTVGTLPDVPGRWLLMREFTSYKLKNNQPLPDNFTLEFDIASQSRNGAKELYALKFGFAHDNVSNSYISDAYNDNAITQTEVHYWNKAINNSSSDTKIHNEIEFPLAQYAIGKMHVAVKVTGRHMVVYLDKVKVLDTDMFLRDNEKKYVYFSTSTELGNAAKIGIGNVHIAAL